MPDPADISELYGTVPIGPLRDRRDVDISSEDYVDDGGFLCEVVDAGDLTYRTFSGAADRTEAGLSAGDAIEVAGVPVVLRAARSSSTVTRIIVGKL